MYLNHNSGVGGNTGPQVSALLSDGSSDSGSLHLSLGVDNDTGVVLEVEENTVLSSPRLGLTDDNGGHDLLSQLRLSLADSGDNHVSSSGSGQTVQTGTESLDGDNVEGTSSRVVSAVDNGADGQTQRHAVLVTRRGGFLGHY